MEARCAQCGTLWRIDSGAVLPAQPYQCNACGHVFTIALEGAPTMQIRHTNGKIYKVKDLATLVRWVGEKRVPRQCMIREDEGEWREAMAVPEVAEAFAMLDARRSQGPSSPAAVAPQAVAAAEEAHETVSAQAADEDQAALDAAAAELLDLDLGDADPPAPEAEETDVSSSDVSDPAEAIETATADANEDEGDHGFDDAFDLLDEMSEEPTDLSGSGFDIDDDDNDDAPKKKSKLPLVAGLVLVVGAGAYFMGGSGGGASANALQGDDPAAKALRTNYEKGVEALAAGDAERMTAAMVALEPAMCLKGCDGKQCVKDDKGACSINKDAAPFAPFFLLADRLWLEANQTDTSLQAHTAAVLKGLEGQVAAKAAFATARQTAVAEHWNAAQPKADETSNKTGPGLQAVTGALPQAPDTLVLLALKQIDGDAKALAGELLTQGTANKEQAPDARLLAFAKARQARMGAAATGCGPVGEAYLAAVKAGMPSVRRELAVFLATNGDIKGAARTVGENAGNEPILKAILAASRLGEPATDAALKGRYAAQIKKTLKSRKSKKIIKYLFKQLGRNKGPTAKRGDLLSGIQEMFPSAIKELMESAWIEVELGQAAQGEAKSTHGAKAMKRFERALKVDANLADALLGRAAAGMLIGQGPAHRTDAFAWLLKQSGGAKAACAAAPAAPAAPEGAAK